LAVRSRRALIFCGVASAQLARFAFGEAAKDSAIFEITRSGIEPGADLSVAPGMDGPAQFRRFGDKSGLMKSS
jgi:hypothetical protein